MFRETRDQVTRILRYCDPDAGWEVAAPVASHTASAYALPKTQLVVLNGNVRDPERFFDRAEHEFEQFLLGQGATSVSFRRDASGAQQHLSWGYERTGREGLVTLWATPDEDRIATLYVTIHESRKSK